jgi:hypothetical protein
MSLINQTCVFIENITDIQSCPWIGRDVYHQNVVNDIINKVCAVFVCILYLFCILYSVLCKPLVTYKK